MTHKAKALSPEPAGQPGEACRKRAGGITRGICPLGSRWMEEEARSGVKRSESTAVQPPVSEWKDLPWKLIQRTVWKLQKRIFRAAQRGDRRAVHRLEKVLMKARAGESAAGGGARARKPGEEQAGG